MRRLVIVAMLWIAGALVAAPVTYEGGYSAPVGGLVDWSAIEEPTRLRKQQVMLLGVKPGEQLRFSVRGVRVGNYTDTVAFRVLGSDGAIVTTGSVDRGAVQEETVAEAKPGVYRLEVDTRHNAAEILPQVNAAAFVATDDHPLGMVYQMPPLYFWVSEEAQLVTVRVNGQGRHEQAAWSIHDGTGAEVAAGNTVDQTGQVDIAVPEGRSGIWHIRLRKLKDHTFEDVALALGGDVCGMVAEHPNALLQPLMQPFTRTDEERVALGVRLYVPRDHLADCTVQVEAVDLQSGEMLFSKTQRQFPPMEVAGQVTAEGFLHARLEAVLKRSDGSILAREEQTVGVAHGEMFREKPYQDMHNPAPVSLAEQQVGFQVYVREEPGFLRPTAHPAEDEVVSTLRKGVALGEFETLFFALYPLQDLPQVEVTVEPFTNAAGDRLDTGAAIRWVRCWPQRTDWRSQIFHVIPELLEHRNQGTLRRKRTQPLAVPLRVPPDAVPGLYTADVTVKADRGAPAKALTLRIDVLPFALQEPPGIVWGLYPDSRRWDSMPQSQIRDEMIDFRDHGITALMLYPQWTADWTWQDGRLSADFEAFRTRMRLYRDVGLGGPMVISLQSADAMLRRLTAAETVEDPVVQETYRQMLALIRRESTEGNWPEFCLHSVDEPHSGEKLQAALRTLKLIKDAGFRTFNTCYGRAVRETLDPYLDYRCYNNIGFLSFPSEEAAEGLRRETLESGDVFWWYGTGCYTNRSFIQDGNMIANRFMGGYHFWRTKASGCWSWTFLRPKGDAYDDFDGQSHREHKDACIAYPTPDGTGLVSTLQWEGLREGIDDYKYLHTLKVHIDKAKAEGAPKQRGQAERFEAELTAILSDMPWTCREGAFTNGRADAVRARLQELILSLDEK